MKSKIKFDVVEFESAVKGFVEAADSRSLLSGEQKKRAVTKAAIKWLDEKIKLPGLWELLSDVVIHAGAWLLSGWIESIYLRWKSEHKAQAAQIEAAVELAEEVIDASKAKKRK